MLWRVRTTLADRPGALAALARRCSEADVNILDLQVFPTGHGVTDELVLRPPDRWKSADVAAIVESAGGLQVAVSPCTVHALHDAPTRYLRAAQQLVHDPANLLQTLTVVLDADDEYAAGPGVAQDAFEFDDGPDRAAVRRVVPFTETERARAAALVDLAGAVRELVGGRCEGPASTAEWAPTRHLQPTDGRLPSVRVGRSGDVVAVIGMHQRCSADTVYHRFRAPIPTITRRLASRLVSPPGGTSLVVVAGDDLVGMATVAPSEGTVFEVGLLIEDTWQRKGLGSRLLHQAARAARAFGAGEVRCLTTPQNDALLPTVARADLQGCAQLRDGSLEVSASVRQLLPLAVEPAAAFAPASPCTGAPTPA